MVRKALYLAIISFWLIMMGILIQREVIPYFGVIRQAPFTNLIKNISTMKKSTMGIYLKEQRIGTMVEEVIPQEDGFYLLKTEMDTQLKLLAFGGHIRANMEFLIDSEGRLSSFTIILSGTIAGKVTGHVHNDGMDVTMRIGDIKDEKWIDLPPNELFTTSLFPFMSVPALVEGMEWEVNQFNPILRSFSTLWLKVERKEIFQWQSQNIPVFVVSMRDNYLTTDEDEKMFAWVTEKGDVLKVTMPGYLSFVKEDETPMRNNRKDTP